jgi:hypothetical protein
LEDEIGKLKAHINTINEILKRHKALEDIITWADDMGPYFLELQKSAKIGYSLYTEIQSERIFLARTKPMEPQTKSVEPKPRTESPESQKKSEEPKPPKDSPESPKKNDDPKRMP